MPGDGADMLIYLGQGRRFYGEKPVKIYARRGWEFQTVIRGAIGLRQPEGDDVLRERHLWIFPPDHPHGWLGERGRGAEVVVFHFPHVPAVLDARVRKAGYLSMPLSMEQCRRLRTLGEQATRYWKLPVAGMAICFEHILMELSLLALESSGQEPVYDPARDRVDSAVQWFLERMAECPSLEEVSEAVSVSPAHLRRMFHDVLQASPKQVLDQLRFQRAMQMMADASIKLEAIGEACGFGSGSAFSRAFKNKYGANPQAWRESYGLGR